MAERIVSEIEKHNHEEGPFVVGLVGIAGSGSIVSAFLLAKLLEESGYPTMVLPHDGYHFPIDMLRNFPDAEDAIYRRGTPDTFDPLSLRRDLCRIKGLEDAFEESTASHYEQPEDSKEDTELMSFPGFDHSKGDVEPDKHTFDPNRHKIIICEGQYLLHDADGWEKIRGLLNFSIYMECNLSNCMERLKVRCLGTSGYKEIEKRCEAVDRPNAEIVQRSQTYADATVLAFKEAPSEFGTEVEATSHTLEALTLVEERDLDAPSTRPRGESFQPLDKTSRANSFMSASTTVKSEQPPSASQFVGTWERETAIIIQEMVDQTPSLPFMVALTGCPGSGKSVSAFLLASILEDAGYPTMVCPHDGYHYPLDYLLTFPDAEDAVYRRGAPDTFDPRALLRDLKRIRGRRQGDASEEETIIKLPAFDHATANPEPDTHIFDRNSHQIVLCEGLYLLHDGDGWAEIADMFDYKIFMNSDIDVCIERVKIRNQCIPGYTPEEIAERCEKVDRVNALTVFRSKSRADVVVQSAAMKN